MINNVILKICNLKQDITMRVEMQVSKSKRKHKRYDHGVLSPRPTSPLLTWRRNPLKYQTQIQYTIHFSECLSQRVDCLKCPDL